MEIPEDVRAWARAEGERRARDPLKAALAALTNANTPSIYTPSAELRRKMPELGASRLGQPKQAEWVASAAREKICEGGNQSGKTWTAVIDFLSEALGLHPARKWSPTFVGATWRGWYATVTYELFSNQAWEHFKRLLLFPGEEGACARKPWRPTRRILDIGWDTKNPERPTYLKLRRTDGHCAEIWIKSYEQGAGVFQSAGVDRVHLDEECPEGIYQEVQVRGVAKNGQITISATPILGVPWLSNLRDDAENGAADVYHARFDTRDNPVADPKFIDNLARKFIHRPELLNLRLGGFPVALEGLVYNDLTFTREHVCDPFQIPSNWTRYRVIDPGWRHCACTWWAVSPGQEDYILYRDFIGHEQTVADNCAAMVALSGGEAYRWTWIDRHYCEKHEEVHGEKIIEVFRRGLAGKTAERVGLGLSVDVSILGGIYDTWELLAQRTGPNGERARFRVFRTCQEFLQERRLYRWPDARAKGDEVRDKPLDRDNHVLKCFAYFWAARPRWYPPEQSLPAPGSTADILRKDRQRHLPQARRL